MIEIGIVVLNFLTYEDTFESIVSLNKYCNIDNIRVLIVDNKTNEDKYDKLQKKLGLLELKFKLIFLSSKENIGFARGMNIGINEAKKNGCTYIVCSNNDIVYNNEVDFKRLIDIYHEDNSIAVIGPKIFNPNMINQNPYMIKSPFNGRFLEGIMQKIIFTNVVGKYLFFIRGMIKYILNKNSHLKEKAQNSRFIYCLHGSFFILTPAYFDYYEELDSYTFLYVEELILAERVKNQKLKEYYFDGIEVFHKDDSSTNEMLGKDSLKKTLFILNENYKSLKYFMKAYIWN